MSMAMLRSGAAGRRRSTITFGNLINLEADIPSTPSRQYEDMTAATVEGFPAVYQDENTAPKSPAVVHRRQSVLPMEPSLFSPPLEEKQEASRLQDEVFDCELRTPDMSDDEETPVKTLLDSPMSFREKLAFAKRQMNEAESVSKSEMGEFLAFVCGPKFAPSASKEVVAPSRPESSCSTFSDMSLDSQYKESNTVFPYKDKEPLVRDEEESEWEWHERQRRLSHHPTSLFRRRPESLSGSMANLAIRCQEQEREIMGKVRAIRERLEVYGSPSSTISPPESLLVSPEENSPTMVCRRLVFDKKSQVSFSSNMPAVAEGDQQPSPRRPPRRSMSSVSELTPPSERSTVPVRTIRFDHSMVAEKTLPVPPSVPSALSHNMKGRQSLTLPRSTILKPTQAFNNPQSSTVLKGVVRESSTKNLLNALQKPILKLSTSVAVRTSLTTAYNVKSLRPALVRHTEKKVEPGKPSSQPLRASLRFDKTKVMTTVPVNNPSKVATPQSALKKSGMIALSPMALAKNVMEFNATTGKYQLSPVVAQSVARLATPKKLSLTPSPKRSPEETFERSLRQPVSVEKVKRQLAFVPRSSMGPTRSTTTHDKLRKALEIAEGGYKKGQIESDEASSSGVSSENGFGNNTINKDEGLLLDL